MSENRIVLYGDRRATCVQRILILLEELKLKYHFEDVSLMKGEHKSEEFLKLQPFGKVPVVKYDDEYIFESRCILRFIARHNRDYKDLYEDITEHDVDQWLEVEGHNFNPHISKIVYEKLFKQMRNEKPDENAVEHSLVELEKVLSIYEKRLQKYDYIAGDNFSIADISHIPYIHYFLKCGYADVIKKHRHVHKWVRRMLRRKHVFQVLSEEFVQEQQQS